MRVAVVVDSVKLARERVCKLIEKFDFHVLEAETAEQFFNHMEDYRYNVDIVFMDIQLPDADGFDLIKKLKIKNSSVPVIVVTAQTNRNMFINGIIAGASEYILKPYEDAELESRFVKIIGSTSYSSASGSSEIKPMITMNLDRFLRGEIRKAQKGKIDLSIMLLAFYDTSQPFNLTVDATYIKQSYYIHRQLQQLFWDTDVFLPYGSQTFIGIFPFCDKGQTLHIRRKVLNKCREIKAEKREFKFYDVQMTFSSYPEDGETREQLLDVLIERMTVAMKRDKQVHNKILSKI
ncbi:response regulator [Desulfuribacillus alkaliarsenatis]|uniref:Response regulatory domain-containing protein n=1 Tax=Desulfuribacillus alkaliarsenatis TaxID=766136 RepID=A0A1E5G188_9FIRM|nr:response regulator [Desulfuribacillus alkaliarsenatis]OEF96674.1 hypothetical protein BHF68_06240 [Desulfuribacillus alkaliarsenatis]